MPIYEILKSDKVINRIVASESFMKTNYPNGSYRLAEVVEETPSIQKPTPVSKLQYHVENLKVFANTSVIKQSLAGDYDVDLNTDVEIICDLVLEGGISIDYGDNNIKVPLVRYANDQATTDEMYANMTIKSSVVSVKFNSMFVGDWRLTKNRLNSALAKLKASWELSSETKDISILV